MFLNRLLGKIRCMRGIHNVVRNRVRRDGMYFTGKCSDCGIPLRKLNGRTWKPYEPDQT